MANQNTRKSQIVKPKISAGGCPAILPLGWGPVQGERRNFRGAGYPSTDTAQDENLLSPEFATNRTAGKQLRGNYQNVTNTTGLRTQFLETDRAPSTALEAIYAEQGIGQRTPRRMETEESAVA